MQNKLVEDNINLVYFLVHKHYPTYRNDEDVLQSGMLGLCKAADTWDESKSVFSTYASKCILNEINMEFRRRRKQDGVLSLNYQVKSDDGYCEMGNLLVGEEDVGYVDVDGVIDALTPLEREVFILLEDGASPSDITHYFGWSRQRTHAILRKIRLLWRKFNGSKSQVSR